ncbi:MAG: flagellar filament capping protein FliD [Myxococcales bacterium]|nr:flagellar filament capping protein FliD [Myxococcales bacterium]
MAGTITFGGIGSGMDVEGLISGLVGASKGPLNIINSRKNNVDSAITVLSDLSGLLSGLKNASQSLDTLEEVGSYSAKSSNEAIVATANGLALPSSYQVSVTQLAQEQRTYSDTFADKLTALGQSGDLDITVGSEAAVNITVEATDTLEDIMTKINESDAKVNASIFYDGSNYRLQVRGKDSGAANAITFGENNGVALGLSTPANTVQVAQDAIAVIDGFNVTSPTNKIAGAIQGVTLALTKKTTEPATLSVETDSDALQGKIKKVVDAYNAVISKVQVTAGYGERKATNSVLAGDSTLRNINSKMTSTLLSPNASLTGKFQTLNSIGIQLENNGMLKLDTTKLTEALGEDPDAVARILAGDDSTPGIMDAMSDLMEGLVEPDSGALTARKEGLEAETKRLQEQADKEQERLDRYSETLRKQFTAMDSTVASYNAQLAYLIG